MGANCTCQSKIEDECTCLDWMRLCMFIYVELVNDPIACLTVIRMPHLVLDRFWCAWGK